MANVFLNNVVIKNAHTGIGIGGAIPVGDGDNLHMDNVYFENVLRPFNLGGIQSGHITRTRIASDPAVTRFRTQSGWTRPNGPPLPIYCPNCKTISTSKTYVFGGLFFQCWDNEETCPECGVFGARLSEGLFDLSGEIARVLSAPDMTYSMLCAISATVISMKDGSCEVSAGIDKIYSVSSALGSIFKKIGSGSTTILQYITVATAILSAYYAKEAVEVARYQAKISQEQAETQRYAIPSPDKVQEMLLEELANLRFVLNSRQDVKPKKHLTNNHSIATPKSKPPTERGPG